MTAAEFRDDRDAHSAEVTAAGIARLAGVGRAAVSNWRRRYAHFPRPIGGTDTSPTFSLPEIERWLRDQGKLAEIPQAERAWQLLQADPAGTADALARVGEQLLQHGAQAPAEADPLVRAAAALAEDAGPATAYADLLGRHLDTGPRHLTLTPRETGDLMAALAGPADSVLDPACGPCTLLAAARGPAADRPPGVVHGQDSDPVLARLGGLRLALRGGAAVQVRAGDSLRADAFSGDAVDVVLCHPPFNDRQWGHDELAYDPRWEYGLPARAESELAWVQHALARLRPGGTAVLLMPPAAASRRTGRRVRAALLRRGALRAVVALPAGVAPPHGLPLHLWVLTKPDTTAPPNPRLLLVDTSAHRSPDRDVVDWPGLRQTVLDAWSAYRDSEQLDDIPGVRRALPVIDLLDDDTDLAPARHLPPASGCATLTHRRRELHATLHRTLELAPAPPDPSPDGQPRWPTVTLGELARAGALDLHLGTATTPLPPPRPGDVLVPLLLTADAPAPRVIPDSTTGDSALPEPAAPRTDRHTCLLRPDPDVLDPWFLAGFLRGTRNTRQASSHASTFTRVDPRRLRVPRLPLHSQRRYGRRFRDLAAFETAVEQAAELGSQLVQGTVDGLADGTLPPD